MLRCFNDCFAVLGLWAAIYCFQRNQWHLGSFFYTTGLNVKMTLLLPLPAMGILMIQALGSREAMTQAMIIFQVSVCHMKKVVIYWLIIIGSFWISIQEAELQLLWTRFRAHPGILLQVDRQLALRFRGNVPVETVCSQPSGHQCWSAFVLRLHTLDQAFQTHSAPIPETCDACPGT